MADHLKMNIAVFKNNILISVFESQN